MARILITALIVAILASGARFAVAELKSDDVKEAQQMVSEFLEKDEGLQKFFDGAAGYAVFPSIGKGAIGIGGAHGDGVVFEGGKAIGETSMTQVTIGFQLGGQKYSEIIFFETKDALNNFTEGKYELAAQASAVAVSAGASADAGYSDGVAIMTMAQGGLMYEASVGGQKFSYEAADGDEVKDKDKEKKE